MLLLFCRQQGRLLVLSHSHFSFQWCSPGVLIGGFLISFYLHCYISFLLRMLPVVEMEEKDTPQQFADKVQQQLAVSLGARCCSANRTDYSKWLNGAVSQQCYCTVLFCEFPVCIKHRPTVPIASQAQPSHHLCCCWTLHPWGWVSPHSREHGFNGGTSDECVASGAPYCGTKPTQWV